MAITLTSEPALQHAAYTPVIFKATTTRSTPVTESNDGLQDSITIPGNVQFNMPATTAFEIDDIITGSGFADSRLNRKMRIINIAGTGTNTQVTVSVTFDSSLAGDLGTLTKTNDNLQLKGECFQFTDSAQSITSAVSNPLGTKLFVNSAANFAVGELVKITGTTSYNGVHEVLAVGTTGGDHIVIGATFVADETGQAYSSEKIATKVISSTINSEYIFNFAGMLQTVLDFDIATVAGLFGSAPNSIRDYGVLFTEQYFDENGILSDFDKLPSTEHEVMNATRQHDEAQDMTAYLLQNSTKKFLTNAPKLEVFDTEDIQLHFVTFDTVTQVRSWVQKYDSAGAAIGAPVQGATTPLTNHRGMLSLDSSSWDANTAYIEVKLTDDLGTTDLSETKRIYIKRNCTSNGRRFYWLNRLGGIDAYTFTANYSEGLQIERETYQRPKDFNFNVIDRGRGVSVIRAKRSNEITSEFVSNAVANWLSELFTSPDVFIKENGQLVPVVLGNKEVSTSSTDMVRLTAQWTYANDLILQNG